MPHTKTHELRLDPEFKGTVPALREEEREARTERIRAEGCRDALVVWPQVEGAPILVDGYNRYAICEVLGVPFRTTEMSFPDRAAAVVWIQQNALARRNLTDDQRAVIARRLERALVKQSNKEKTERGHEALRRKRAGQPALAARAPRERMQVVAARLARVPVRKMQLVRDVEQHNPSLLDKVSAGEMSLVQAHRQVLPSIHRKPHSTGMGLAHAAIHKLEQIAEDDPTRERALQYVRQWLDAHQKTTGLSTAS